MSTTIKTITNSHLEFKIVLSNNGRREDYDFEGEQPTQLKAIRLLAQLLAENGKAEIVEVMINCGGGWEVLNTYSRRLQKRPEPAGNPARLG